MSLSHGANINGLAKRNILVVGDVMLDVYNIGEVKRISPEAPVPVFKKRTHRWVLGGAGNVAVNLIAANQNASICAVIGNDPNGILVRYLLEEKGIDTSLLVVEERPTTTKTRFLADGNQQVIRVDDEDTSPISKDVEDELIASVSKRIGEFDAVIISDYMKGLLTPRLTQAVISAATEYGSEVYVDVKDPNIEKYADATLLKPNRAELKFLSGMPVDSIEAIEKAAMELISKAGCALVLCTLGAEGMALVNSDGFIKRVTAEGKEVFDVSGAGDTAIAYLVACRANGMDYPDSMEVANLASGVQVSKVGTSAVYLDEVAFAIEGHSVGKIVKDRIVDEGFVKLIRTANVGKRIVFTNGCFDILHVGHVKYLRQAAALGDMLVVGVNSDSSVRRLKGEGRPINNIDDRVAMLASFDFIDYVIVFDEETPYEVIRAIQPDVLVKGGDYDPSQIVGRDIVENLGGEVLVIPYIDGKSSTGIIERIAMTLDTRSGDEE